jgi:hypothetical protein
MPPLLLTAQPTGSTSSSPAPPRSPLRSPKQTQAEPEPKKELKLEDVRKVLAERSRAGYTAQIRELLHKYGASKLSAVDPKDYEALLFDVEGLNEF